MVAAFLFWLLILCKLSKGNFNAKQTLCYFYVMHYMKWRKAAWFMSDQTPLIFLNFKVRSVPYWILVSYHWSETQFFILSFSSSP